GRCYHPGGGDGMPWGARLKPSAPRDERSVRTRDGPALADSGAMAGSFPLGSTPSSTATRPYRRPAAPTGRRGGYVTARWSGPTTTGDDAGAATTGPGGATTTGSLREAQPPRRMPPATAATTSFADR